MRNRRNKGAGKNLFNSVKITAPGSNLFDLTHDFKFSCNMGELIPIMNMPCVPGDKVFIKPSALIRLAPMLAPMMHRVDVSIHYFFVPNRILWPGFEDFINNGTSGTDGSQVIPAFPYVDITANAGGNYGPLADYLGIPTPLEVGEPYPYERVSALPFLAYQKICNNYYRDQNLIQEYIEEAVDGDNTAYYTPEASGGVAGNFGNLRKRAWEHDYLTSCLPFAQKGAAVEIPIGSSEVVLNEDSADAGQIRRAADHVLSGTGPVKSTIGIATVDSGGGDIPVVYDPAGTLVTQTLQPVSINDLRAAEKLQQFLEKLARAGSRFVELIKGVFNVDTGDARVDIPEYITGIKTPVQISEVLNMTGTEEAPQGNMAGHGVSVAGGQGGSYYVREHGYIIGIMSVMPRTAYQQGLNRDWFKFDPLDFYWPDFAHLGEQAVLNKEAYAFQEGDDGNVTFGYVPRYAEYRYLNNRVAGEFKTSLSMWHMGRIFEAPPALNQQFVESDPTHRVFAVQDPTVQKLYVQVVNGVTASRKMPVYGTPNL